MTASNGIETTGTPGPLLRTADPRGATPRQVRGPESEAAGRLDALAGEPTAAVADRLAAAALGGLSVALYALLFWFDEELLELAQSTRRGDKRFFFVPIAVALLFSFVHGAFTGRFCDVLGLKAKT